MRSSTGDFREFAFLATGDMTKVRALTLTDLVDNLEGELRRLDALSNLLRSVPDEVPAATVQGSGELVRDAVKRMRIVLRLAAQSSAKDR